MWLPCRTLFPSWWSQHQCFPGPTEDTWQKDINRKLDLKADFLQWMKQKNFGWHAGILESHGVPFIQTLTIGVCWLLHGQRLVYRPNISYRLYLFRGWSCMVNARLQEKKKTVARTHRFFPAIDFWTRYFLPQPKHRETTDEDHIVGKKFYSGGLGTERMINVATMMKKGIHGTWKDSAQFLNHGWRNKDNSVVPFAFAYQPKYMPRSLFWCARESDCT